MPLADWQLGAPDDASGASPVPERQAVPIPANPNLRPEVPDPTLVAAWLVLEQLDTTSVPLWASWWIVDGQDGPALRQLAGQSGRDPFDVRDALRQTLEEMNLPLPTIAEASRQAFTHAARRCLEGRVDELTVARLVERIYVDTGYCDDVRAQPLGATYGIDDEWGAGWGRNEPDLREAVRDACRQQLRRT